MTDRATLLLLLNAARVAGRQDYIRHVAADWLSVWPGDREVARMLASAESDLGFHDLASGRLASIVVADPEDSAAYEQLSAVLRAQGRQPEARVFEACALALRPAPLPAASPDWARSIHETVLALASGESNRAHGKAHEAMVADPDLPLPTLMAMKAALAEKALDEAALHAESGNSRWPETVAFRLILAWRWMQEGKTARAVEALHRAASDDPTGVLASRYLDGENRYGNLWPVTLTARLSRPIPADVAAVLGENRLGFGRAPQHSASGEVSPAAPSAADAPFASVLVEAAAAGANGEEAVIKPESWEAFQGPDAGQAINNDTLEGVQLEFQRMAVRLNAPSAGRPVDRRAPVYVIAATKTRILQEFGRDTFRRIDEALLDLQQAVRGRKGWLSCCVYLDDAASLRTFGLAPAEPTNAWQLKLRLTDLDRVLARRNQRLGALLIIGGPRLFPFHDLPNPTDDDDSVVPSDNPYATTDENYFVPEWPVGRLPVDSDPDLLVRAIRRAADHHLSTAQPSSPLGRIGNWLRRRLGWVLGPHLRTFGYSASIWRRASMAVYKTIGEPQQLVTSPPAAAGAMPAVASRPSRLSYFNLHGVEDAPEWFGQRDPLTDESVSVEFPVALRPQDVVNGGRAPAVVYSEACYGAHVDGKSQDTALSLKFLDSGSQAVVGSTKISYGSVNTPLIAADLLGRLYWEQLNQGMPSGEALRRAKLALASEMLRRQGYLDGEDQKTIISFVHFGDPLFVPDPARSLVEGKAIALRRPRPAIPAMACALGSDSSPAASLDAEALEKVRLVVAQYLPGMSSATRKIHRQRCDCDGLDHRCLSYHAGQKATQASGPETTVVTLSKQVEAGHIRHSHFARLTLDRNGRILKLAVSR